MSATDLDALRRTISPTGRRELRHVATYQDTHGVPASSIHPAARDALLSRGLIELAPGPNGHPDRLARLTNLGRQVVEEEQR